MLQLMIYSTMSWVFTMIKSRFNKMEKMLFVSQQLQNMSAIESRYDRRGVHSVCSHIRGTQFIMHCKRKLSLILSTIMPMIHIGFIEHKTRSLSALGVR